MKEYILGYITAPSGASVLTPNKLALIIATSYFVASIFVSKLLTQSKSPTTENCTTLILGNEPPFFNTPSASAYTREFTAVLSTAGIFLNLAVPLASIACVPLSAPKPTPNLIFVPLPFTTSAFFLSLAEVPLPTENISSVSVTLL